ncbi:alpha/beta hydrolase [Paenibacillus sp. FSL K6-3166]|uniref:alpha/beta hydrolase n=1 Tax=unclassified Paenibacillus TaxID=185978 RepID=UPI000BA02A61|nr:alpha/beta hydrolase [Paenibacillus sp. VTT E-133291]OZQ85482.1 alpha/beta hydrolase [Paenibacillus sp. VTT E-133291]
MSKYKIHSDFEPYEKRTLPLNPLLLPILNKLIARSLKKFNSAEGVKVTKKVISGYKDGSVQLTIIEPEGISQNAPCLIYIHGGAFVLKAAPSHIHWACEYASKTPCKVIFVDYRLAPKYAFPYGVEDCYAAFEWASDHADALGIDRSRIAIGGDSAGGALAAAVTLMARDRQAPPICFQMLLYPVTDARQTTESIKEFTDTPLWNSELNEKMWKLYLKNGVAAGKREYASPMEATSLKGLPNAYVEITEFDCLRDEGIHYAEALQECGVQVELYHTKGTIHGYDIAEKSGIVQQSVARRIEALRGAFK